MDINEFLPSSKCFQLKAFFFEKINIQIEFFRTKLVNVEDMRIVESSLFGSFVDLQVQLGYPMMIPGLKQPSVSCECSVECQTERVSYTLQKEQQDELQSRLCMFRH